MGKVPRPPLRELSEADLISSSYVGGLKYSAVEVNTKKGASAVRYGLIKEGTTVDEHIRRVFEYYAKKGNLRVAAAEAAKVVPDIKWDMQRNFYELLDDSDY